MIDVYQQEVYIYIIKYIYIYIFACLKRCFSVPKSNYQQQYRGGGDTEDTTKPCQSKENGFGSEKMAGYGWCFLV